ncbi:ferredoxin [Rhodococcus sp. ACS1]|uniref:ferredoxin n=1 Tax=Rhodococcus sp. ACS1 TaxID=2028570 RepID=UPI000BB1017D|nr:ferredoxin [Rhodococcus sp. ACS1]PBC35615.1 ferredoxin [Rhodococcus sp. ACS1]
MHLDVDLELCTGHGRCYALEPDIFEPFDDDGRARISDSVEASDPDLRDRLVSVERACPEQALIWRDNPQRGTE